MLAHGFQRPSMGSNAVETNIPGIVIQFPNQNVQTLKEPPWADVLGLLGSSGEEIMMRLLFDCGLFTAINAKEGVFYQLSGALFHPSYAGQYDGKYIMLTHSWSLM